MVGNAREAAVPPPREAQSQRWSGIQRGTRAGYGFFRVLLQSRLRVTIPFFLFWVALYFVVAAPAARRISFALADRLGRGGTLLRRLRFAFWHMYTFGLLILDRSAILSGLGDDYAYRFEGEEHITGALAEGRGVVLVTGHIGSSDVMGQLLVRLERPVTIVMFDGVQPSLKESLERMAASRSFEILYTDGGPATAARILAALRRGEIVGMMGDRVLHGRGVEAPFLGGTAVLPAGPFAVAAMAEAPLLHVFAVRTGSRRYTFRAYSRGRRSGVIYSAEREARGFRSPLMTRLPEIDYASELDRRARRYMPEPAIYGAAAANRALASAGLTREKIARDDVGIIVGNDSSSSPLPELMATLDKYKESRFLGSHMVIKVMNSTVSMNLGRYLGARGINLTLSAACASGAHAIGLGYRLVQTGEQRMILAGGVQETNWLSMVSFDALNAFSVRKDEPEKASRPFDRDRDGLVPGGGGAVLVLESLESATRRDAQIFGEITGYGYSSDGEHLTMPSGDGARRCMEMALERAGLTVGDIDYIGAHATSTPVGDRAEAHAIHEVFGADGPPVSSTKSMTGHECWMAGASEAIYALLMMRDGFLAPNVNFSGFDDDIKPIHILRETASAEPNAILSNSFGFGGTNASLVLQRLAR